MIFKKEKKEPLWWFILTRFMTGCIIIIFGYFIIKLIFMLLK